MSGRKSSEVASVLDKGEKVRGLSDEMILAQVRNDFENIIKNAQGLTDLQASVSRTDGKLSEAAQKLMGDKAEQVLSQYQLLKREILTVETHESEARKVLAGMEQVSARLRKADSRAADIRRSIAAKEHGWYCDEEYRQAQQLLEEYKSCRQEQQRLQNSMMNLAHRSQNELHNVQAKVNRARALHEQLQDMNETAERKLASDEQRGKLQGALDKLDVAKAQKFLATEFSSLQKDIEQIINSADNVVLQNFSGAYGRIGAFSSQLQSRYEQWKREKADAESFLHEVDVLTKVSYHDPIDYYNKGTEGEKISLFAYLGMYAGNNEYKNQATKLMQEARAEFQAESFTACMKTLEQAKSIILEARDKALKLQDNMLNKTELAGAIQNVMEDLRYDVNVEVIDDNPSHGYRIVSKFGDETIDFDRIDVDENGNYIVNIDHQESRTGTCGASWQVIVNEMKRQGVPMTDVKKNGVSVLQPARKSAQQESHQVKQAGSI